MKVDIGRQIVGVPEDDSWNVAELDIGRLVETRAIVQAASGFGKSYLMCELIEATHGYIQQIIIDPEGEFSPLRAGRDFVIAAAENGDAVAHPRTAGLLATKLLETGASAILDIYDVKPLLRAEFVKNFIESLMNSPKSLWHPTLIFLDEAHLFCPEKGFGESVATDAVIDLAGRGRKRGFTLIAATQRIGKFNKNALAELNNKFIGSASLDVDVKRAAFELGMQPKDALTKLRELKPGDFYAFGPALGMPVPTRFVADLPTTKLPKAGVRKLTAPPKPTASIRALLPQFADIPKEVEQKAKTESELRKELTDTKRELEHLKRVQPIQAASIAKLKEKPAPKVNYKAAYRESKKFLKAVEMTVEVAIAEMRHAVDKTVHEWQNTLHHRIHTNCENAMEVIRQAAESQDGMFPSPALHREPKMVAKYVHKKVELDYEIKKDEDDSGLTGPEQRVLDALVWLESATGGTSFRDAAVASIARYSPRSSAYKTPRGKLGTMGLISMLNGMIEITDAGREKAMTPPDPPTKEEMHRRVLGVLGGPEQRLLKPLLEIWPEPMSNEDLAKAANYSPDSSAYKTPRGKLGTLGMIEFKGGYARAMDFLFP